MRPANGCERVGTWDRRSTMLISADSNRTSRSDRSLPPNRIWRPQRAWRRILVLASVTLLACLIGYAEKAPSLTHVWADGFQYTHACYSDIVALYYAEHLDRGERPYLDHPVEYPVLTGATMYVIKARH